MMLTFAFHTCKCGGHSLDHLKVHVPPAVSTQERAGRFDRADCFALIPKCPTEK